MQYSLQEHKNGYLVTIGGLTREERKARGRKLHHVWNMCYLMSLGWNPSQSLAYYFSWNSRSFRLYIQESTYYLSFISSATMIDFCEPPIFCELTAGPGFYVSKMYRNFSQSLLRSNWVDHTPVSGHLIKVTFWLCSFRKRKGMCHISSLNC